MSSASSLWLSEFNKSFQSSIQQHRNLIPRVLSYSAPVARESSLSFATAWGRVGEDPENEVDNTDVKPATAVAIPIKTQ